MSETILERRQALLELTQWMRRCRIRLGHHPTPLNASLLEEAKGELDRERKALARKPKGRYGR